MGILRFQSSLGKYGGGGEGKEWFRPLMGIKFSSFLVECIRWYRPISNLFFFVTHSEGAKQLRMCDERMRATDERGGVPF